MSFAGNLILFSLMKECWKSINI